jgi:hypothetical protein
MSDTKDNLASWLETTYLNRVVERELAKIQEAHPEDAIPSCLEAGIKIEFYVKVSEMLHLHTEEELRQLDTLERFLPAYDATLADRHTLRARMKQAAKQAKTSLYLNYASLN